MSTIKPFKGVRPRVDLVNEIAALPYDVYSSKEARVVIKDKPISFLKIDRAETFFSEDVDPYSTKVYEKARDTMYNMIGEYKLIQDQKECLYIYQLTMDGRTQTGIVACTSIDEYINNTIKKHELTRAEKEADRINHVDYCDANTGPIFLTYKAKESINTAVSNWIANHKTEYDFVADDSIRHAVWVLDDTEIIHQLQEGFKMVDSLYIADGHHRAASAVKVGLKRREANPNDDGTDEFNYFLSVIFPDEQLKIMDYNRVVKDLGGLTPEAFMLEVEKNFDILETSKEQIRPIKKCTFGMYLEDTWYLLKTKEGSYNSADPVLSLDVSILQLNLLAPILGIGDPRTDNRIDFVGGIRGLGELERRVKEDMTVAFALVPTSIEELMNIADVDELMPPKSTWFEPKLRSGLFIHLLK
ncbi:MAG: DUF1015 domain-containing protein [Firmicutes bacterium HGW-Firmicutes-1]|jgi:uncharacterized protein (DUF1015 family)|nr:MAG: DUF1015 domain-containing protein [Firmicutes bacterium HGW-Firmicutes-1]